MTIYYAHCIAIYSTPQEVRDMKTLRDLGFSVVNPNTPEVDAEVKRLKGIGTGDYMWLFKDIIEKCDALAFRSLPDGRIPAGVLQEILWAREANKLVIELPSNMLHRKMSLESTREYLLEVGKR